MVSSVKPWWAGLCARVFDKLRLTGLFYVLQFDLPVGSRNKFGMNRWLNLFWFTRDLRSFQNFVSLIFRFTISL